MKNDFRKFSKLCEICKTQKYEGVPIKQPIGSTLIPINQNKQYVTSVDRYSKSLIVWSINSKIHFHEKIEEILTQCYPNCKTLIIDNDPILVINAAKIINNKYKIAHITIPV